jgi:hypothetical protein
VRGFHGLKVGQDGPQIVSFVSPKASPQAFVSQRENLPPINRRRLHPIRSRPTAGPGTATELSEAVIVQTTADRVCQRDLRGLRQPSLPALQPSESYFSAAAG